jgi:hypothetical protein
LASLHAKRVAVSLHWPPTFNVIYLPGTIRTLFAFVRSLAEHSPFRYRLVSNACTAAEESFLANEASGNPRFDVASLESKTVLPHGEALQRLFAKDTADTFACIDSDIFASGPFLTAAQSLLSEHAALFSGLPVWQPPEERVMPARFVFMSGRFSHTEDGLCLGVSYCTIYRRAELESVMDRTGVTFHRRGWSELSSQQRTLLTHMNLAKRRYDTAKLMNLMLVQSGLSLTLHTDPNLLHVGALSAESQRPQHLIDKIIARLREIADASWPGPIPRRRADERAAMQSAFARRRLVETYVQHLLAGGAIDGGPVASFPATVRQQVIQMGGDLLALRRRYGSASS